MEVKAYGRGCAYHDGQESKRMGARAFYHLGPSYEIVLPIVRVGLPSLVSSFWKHPQRHTQKCSALTSYVIQYNQIDGVPFRISES